jgi:phosphosulfolactate synthase
MTMIIDRELGLHAVKDLCQMIGSSVDYIKLGFGTPALVPLDFLKEKIELIQSYSVKAYFGGTLFEIATQMGAYEAFLKKLKSLAISTIEISDGVLPVSRIQRGDCIRMALDQGLRVLTEVGKKDPRLPLSPAESCEQILEDFDMGASQVIIESRESGKGIGIFDKNGQVKEDFVDQLISPLTEHQRSRLIWEAPLKDQQVFLLKRFGCNVNLGNINPADALGLEALRCGLRWDTIEFLGVK